MIKQILPRLDVEHVRYLARCSVNWTRRHGTACPSCGSNRSSRVDRKFLVTELRRCGNCKLLFRTPTTSPSESAEFYEKGYSEGFTTSMPSGEALHDLLEAGFEGSPKDYNQYVSVIKALGVKPSQRIIDFGCSWGYGSWQLAKAGFRVRGFEVSSSRCSFARDTLGVDATSEIADLAGAWDCFFSAHVIEHVPSVSEMLHLAAKLLVPGGLFVAFTPNGCEQRRNRNPNGWHKNWGLAHPQLIDADFFIRAAAPNPIVIASTPFDLAQLGSWNNATSARFDLSGDELLVAFRLISPAGF